MHSALLFCPNRTYLLVLHAVLAVVFDSFQAIRDTCISMYSTFKEDPMDVQREWASFVRKFDQLLEDNLRASVKRSLQDLSRAINGDAKNDPPPLFKVSTHAVVPVLLLGLYIAYLRFCNLCSLHPFKRCVITSSCARLLALFSFLYGSTESALCACCR